jgi:hypothetical protein
MAGFTELLGGILPAEIADLSTCYKHFFVLTNFSISLAKEGNLCANVGFNYMK